jgi:hypothetical protein
MVDGLEGGYMLIVPKAQIGGRDATFRYDRGSFNKDKARSSRRAGA